MTKKESKRAWYASLKKSQLKHLEEEVRVFEIIKVELEEARNNILMQRNYSVQDGPRGTDISDTTYNTAIKLMTTTAIRDMEKTVYAIERAMREFPVGDSKKAEFIQEMFFNRTLTPKGIQLKLHVSETTFWKWRENFLLLVALYKGYKVYN